MYAYMYVCIYYVCMCRNNAGRVYSHALEAGIQVVESDLTQADNVFSLVPPRTNPQCMYVCMYVCMWYGTMPQISHTYIYACTRLSMYILCMYVY